MRAVMIGLVTVAWLTLAAAQPASAATMNLAPRAAAADGQIDVCGNLQALSPARADQLAAQLVLAVNGASVQYALTGSGTITPPNIAALGTGLNPVLVRVRGLLTGANLSNYSVSQVVSCVATLPTTSTADEGESLWWVVLAAAAVVLAAAGLRRSPLG